jgi:hypothetical protein
MREILIARFGKVIRGDRNSYNFLVDISGLNSNSNLTYSEKIKINKDISSLLGLSERGGLAGRNINEY